MQYISLPFAIGVFIKWNTVKCVLVLLLANINVYTPYLYFFFSHLLNSQNKICIYVHVYPDKNPTVSNISMESFVEILI